jgi:glycosyltransferase involved in cell wall biosynthesis
MENVNIRITIIIAVWHGAKTLQKCLDSIRAQSYPNIELIIMDADSNDGTKDIILSNKDLISYWESKKDRGIYHAWNKALKHATGDWICFLGSDDYWAYPNAIQDMVAEAKDGINLISGKVSYVDEAGNVKGNYGKAWLWKDIKRSHCIAHPGALFHKSIFEKFGEFDESYRIAADYEFSLRLGEYVQPAFLDRVLVFMGDSGVSRDQLSLVMKESWRAKANHPDIGRISASLGFLRTYIIIHIKKILGKF